MIEAIELSSIEIGGKWGQRVSYYFEAHFSGPLASFRPYWIIQNPPGETGYTSGTGGKFVYAVYTDDTGQPGELLGSAVAVPDADYPQPTDKRGIFPLVQVEGTVELEAGKWYHLVITNVDPEPAVNWSVLDFLVGPQGQVTDAKILLSAQNGPFKWEPQFIPSPMAVFFADGSVQGLGFIEVENGKVVGGEEYGYPASICQ